MLFKKNIKYLNKVKLSSWRKSAFGSWKMTGDCQVYCIQTLNVEKCLEQVKLNEDVTITHIAGACVAKMIEENPVINRVIRMGQYFQREDISIFFQVASDSEGKDLSGHTVQNANKKGITRIAEEMNKNVKRIKSGDDFNYKKVKNTMEMVPTILVPTAIKTLGFAMYTLNLWSKSFGPPQDAFGSAMITNVGSLGFQTGFAPLVPYSRVPLILAMGKVYDKAVPVDGKIEIQKCIDFCWTSDHRLIDGVTGAKMIKSFEKYILNPEQLL